MLIVAILICVTIMLLWILSGYLPTRNIEMPGYTVIEKKGEYEVRRYDSFIVAEVRSEGNPAEALSKGFNELFRYISGENVSESKISMTAPVFRSEDKGGRKIPMTAPVLKEEQGESSIISFVMPPDSTLETLPKPKNPAITLRAVPPHTVAVITFSGYATEEAIAEKTAILLNALQRDGLAARSVPRIALYNPPWTPPFMRRNEVMVDVDLSR